MHDAQQREEDRVEKPDDRKHHPDQADRLLMRGLFDCQPQPVFEPVQGLIQVGLGDEVGQLMLGWGLGLRLRARRSTPAASSSFA